MGVSAPKHNTQNQLLLEGARRMGFARADVPQNNGGGDHACGHDCANLCRSGGKKGGVHSWLVDASKAGAKFITGAEVRHIDFDAKKGRAARGVVLRFNDGTEKYVKTPRVLVCAGSVSSPAVLLRSKIPNSRIGQSLYLHPTNYVHAVFDHETHPVDGQILTSVVGEYADLDGSGHGVRVETGCMQPVLCMCLMQWTNGLEAKARFLKHPNMVGCIAIARDAKPGKVTIDKAGEPIVDYTVANVDIKSVITGTIAAAECMRAVGAKEIIVAGRAIPEWREGDDWDTWVRKVAGSTPGGYGSAHQMGSNRMGSSTSNGACDPTGAVYGVQGVWVADASVLPSASGVNPMVSTMAVASMIGRGVVQAWREGRVETKPNKAKL
ncbi:hypothetical protein VHUM_04233 [Vanrija humicola]|uniref:Glucose-methanol-choline oxidoreductase N-terminal domain-containing protein n=1 Tax=Vanrija humicola TaxID=5417 RepID=A0A7D8UW11_VANHU|nr:hypothetical protein VHUM_04233 [Vanrija humicola]